MDQFRPAGRHGRCQRAVRSGDRKPGKSEKEAERRIREAAACAEAEKREKAARAEVAKREAAARAEAEKREKERLQAEEAARREKQRREEEAARQEKLRRAEEVRRTLEIYKREQEARRLEKQERLEAERRYHQPRQRDTANKTSLFQSAWAQGGQLIQKLLDQGFDKDGEEECRQRPFERRPQTQQMREELNRQSMLANWIKQAEERNRPIPMPADLVTRARAGDPEAQWRLGTCYYLGHRDFSTNYARFLRAAYWFQKSAEQGYALGQFDYGNCFACGAGVEKDLNTAAQWWEKAAMQDLSMARKILTHCWYNRDQRVVKVDDLELLKTDTYYMTKFYCPPLTAEAAQERDRQNKLYEKIKKAKFASAGDKLQILIDRGDLDAIAFVGYCCRYGESGFERDIPKGVALLKRAAEENYMFAQWCYGNCFATGAGVEQDLDAAAMWWRKAADQGSELACNSLNHCRFDFTDHVIGLDGLHLKR